MVDSQSAISNVQFFAQGAELVLMLTTNVNHEVMLERIRLGSVDPQRILSSLQQAIELLDLGSGRSAA